MNQNIIEWNRENYPLKIIDGRIGVAKTTLSIMGVLILLAFLSLFAIRTFYYDFYRDVVDVSNICQPLVLNNMTVEKQCGDVDVDCKCIDENKLEDILNDVCPDTINIHMNPS